MASSSAADSRQSDPSHQFDVDSMILDYISYNAAKSVLHHAKTREQRTGCPSMLLNELNMVNSFIERFKANHKSADVPLDLRLRTQLIHFATFFVFRHSGSSVPIHGAGLAQRRIECAARAETWLANSGLAIFPRALRAFWDSNYTESGGRHENSTYASLLDLVPSFIELTGTRTDGWTLSIDDEWLELAAKMMLQAALEQYTELKATDRKPITEAFAWGFEGMASGSTLERKAGECSRSLTDTVASSSAELTYNDLNLVFCNITDTPQQHYQASPNPTWTKYRDYYSAEFTPEDYLHKDNDDEGDDDDYNKSDKIRRVGPRKDVFLAHLKNLSSKYPYADFEADILKFLEAMTESAAPPILVQLERGAGSNGGAALEINVGFERVRVTGEEAKELEELAASLRKS